LTGVRRVSVCCQGLEWVLQEWVLHQVSVPRVSVWLLEWARRVLAQQVWVSDPALEPVHPVQA
jgi:hypothetical protein